jgi:hypothetical protein
MEDPGELEGDDAPGWWDALFMEEEEVIQTL